METHEEESYSAFAGRDNAAITNKKKTEALADTFVLVWNSIVYLRRKEQSDAEAARGRYRRKYSGLVQILFSISKCLNSTEQEQVFGGYYHVVIIFF